MGVPDVKIYQPCILTEEFGKQCCYDSAFFVIWAAGVGFELYIVIISKQIMFI